MYHLERRNLDSSTLTHSFPIKISEADTITLTMQNFELCKGYSFNVKLSVNYHVQKMRKMKLFDRLTNSNALGTLLKSQFFELVSFKEFEVQPKIEVNDENVISITVPPKSCLVSSSKSLLVCLGFPEDSISNYMYGNTQFHAINNMFSFAPFFFDETLPEKLIRKGSTWKSIHFGFIMADSETHESKGNFITGGDFDATFFKEPLMSALSRTRLSRNFLTVVKKSRWNLEVKNTLITPVKVEVKLTGSALQLFKEVGGHPLREEFNMRFGDRQARVYKLMPANEEVMERMIRELPITYTPEIMFHVCCMNMPTAQRAPDGVVAYVDKKLRVFPLNKIILDNGEHLLKFEFLRTDGKHVKFEEDNIIRMKFLAEYHSEIN